MNRFVSLAGLVAVAAAFINPPRNATKGKIHIPLKLVKTKLRHGDSFLQTAAMPTPKFLLQGTVDVGTPPYSFTVAFDTASGNLVLPDYGCRDPACTSRNSFRVSSSATAEIIPRFDNPNAKSPEVVHLSFGRGFVEGVTRKDVICFSKTSCVRGSFVSATKMSTAPFSALPYDGVIGLALPESSIRPDFNIVTVLAQERVIEREIFALWMKDSHDPEDGEFTLGGWNQNRLQSRVVWLPVMPNAGVWSLHLKGLWIKKGNNKAERVLSLAQKPVRTIIDSGSTMIIGTPKELLSLTDQIDSKECTSGDTKIGLQLNDHVFFLEPRDYLVSGELGCDNLMTTLSVPPPRGPDVWLLGYPFLKKYYSIFDRETLRVGFGLAVHTPASIQDAQPTFEEFILPVAEPEEE